MTGYSSDLQDGRACFHSFWNLTQMKNQESVSPLGPNEKSVLVPDKCRGKINDSQEQFSFTRRCDDLSNVLFCAKKTK